MTGYLREKMLRDGWQKQFGDLDIVGVKLDEDNFPEAIQWGYKTGTGVWMTLSSDVRIELRRVNTESEKAEELVNAGMFVGNLSDHMQKVKGFE